LRKKSGSDSSSNGSEDDISADAIDKNLVIEEEVRGKMHKFMNQTQGLWFTNEFKKIEYLD
jgi:hypothetical protein